VTLPLALDCEITFSHYLGVRAAQCLATIHPTHMLRLIVLLSACLAVHGQFGRKKEPEDPMRAQAAGAAQDGATARDFELENMARHKAGELNAAELGLSNMKAAMSDPSIMAEMAEMMKDPENQRQLKEMMADPAFQQQAKGAMQQMMGSTGGQMPDLSRLMNDPEVMAKAKQMAAAMYGGGATADNTAAEIARLQAENARLKQRFA